jgi:hypothetical protein
MTNWPPIIVKSSVSLGMLPEAKGVSPSLSSTSIHDMHGVVCILNPFSCHIKHHSCSFRKRRTSHRSESSASETDHVENIYTACCGCPG